MADESETAPAPVAVATRPEAKTPAATTPRAPRRLKAAGEPVRVSSKATAAKSPTVGSRKLSDQDKTEKLKLIETQINQGASTLKDAAKSAGISEQTYYNWKRSEKPVEQTVGAPVTVGDEFADLVQLEEENRRLRKILAEKLRAENTELRRRLGLD